jgi:tetratricopeptide (TPR) repeat protein
MNPSARFHGFRAARRLIPVPAVVLIVQGLLHFANPARATSPPSSDPFTPTVTARESKQLAAAMAVAATNAAAASRLLASIDLTEASPAMDFAVGNLHFQSDRLEEAAASYEAALVKMPLFRQAMVNLGRVYLLQDTPDRASTLYRRLVADGQATGEILLLLGHALLLQDHPVSAENAYRQALLLDPGNRDALAGLTRCLLRQERVREATGLVKELLDAGPEADLWSLYVNALLASDRGEEAIVAAETARRLGQADADMLAALGDLYLNSGRPAEAVERYETAFANDSPSIPRMLLAVEGFLMLRRQGEAARLIARLDATLDEFPESLDTRQKAARLRLKGELAAQQGRPEEAASIYADLLELDPLDGRTLILLGDLRRDAQRPEDALLSYERAARVAGYEAEALVRQAQLEVERGRFDRAVQLLEAAQAFEERPHVARYLEQVRRLTR